MGHKSGVKHLKRLATPSFWPLHRKEYTWAPKPHPGAHKAKACLPLGLIVREETKSAKTRRETTQVLAGGKVKIDGRRMSDVNYPVGLMDVVEFQDANASYRILPVQRHGLSMIRITKDEAKFKLCKIMDRRTGAKGATQIFLHDGRTIGLPKEEAAPYATNDTLRISVPTQRILGHIPFQKSNLALVVAGRNQGKNGKVLEMQNGTATRPAMVTIEDSEGNRFDTVKDYTFIVGTDKTAIKLEAS
jgi:small subunit ribosomal protein S4e